MKTFIYICLGLFVIFFMFEMIRKAISNKITNDLVECIYLEKDDEFEEIIKSKHTKFWVFPYNILFLKLNMFMANNDEKQVKTIVDELEKLTLKTKQKEAIYQRCFSYYVTINNAVEAEKYYKLLKTNKEDVTEEIDIIYHTLVLKDDKYLNYCLERNDGLKNNDLISNESYISQMYANKGDKRNSEKYRESVTKKINDLNSINKNKNNN